MAYTTINKGSSYFNTVLYTGNNGASQSITGVGFQPDFVWIKNRTDARNHVLTDIVRGATKTLFSQSTSAEVTNPTDGYLSSFGSDGFSVSQGSVNNENVCATDNYVSWNWLANNTSGSSNTSGTITSTVAANTTAGFSIVSYTGAGGASTVGHGLGVIPKMIILKGRSNARIWVIGHVSLGWTKYMSFDTATVQTNNYWNDTTPTSSVFSVFSSVNVNGSGETYVAYCFAEVKGFSKFGSYTGNSSADGTFVYTGFKPAFVIVKNTNYGSGTDWYVFDNKRNTYNVENLYLNPNLSAAEATGVETDFLSNGFKLRHSSTAMNNSSYTYIYMAFAENPFVTSGGIPVTAR
jgi:hypothetical protein